MRLRTRGFGALLIGLSVVVGTGEAAAQSAPCVDLCRIPCVKPISFADRWDDVTGIPGYMGEVLGRIRRPDWRNNAQYNFESFTDANANGLWDAGESYTDNNANGSYDRELYDPSTTGYAPTGDLGMAIVLHAGSPTGGAAAGQYFSVGLPPVNKGTPLLDSGSYSTAWRECAAIPIEPLDALKPTPGALVSATDGRMRELISLDPHARRDHTTQSVLDSDFALSPRVWFIPVHDPRIPIVSGAPQLVVRKVVAFFAEALTGPAECRGRLLRVQAAGEACGGGPAGGLLVNCPVPAPATSRGRVKATYR